VALDDAREHRINLVGRSDVAGDRLGVPVRIADLTGGPPRRRLVEIEDHHPRVLPGEQPRDRGANAGARAGDDGDLVLQLEDSRRHAC